eukprot:CAMPEP_0178400874 /NCGR_PEP_ID=MMETSP0689_2-20121128/16012_1 /TAXON_ID=160604 /ORGANISM="Amphidinium massartii, Strain CS-259" /LENGTH=95 /DNA_ID=CAMNT_0020021679 /DNA_START=86 /DNA_END=369 /DNA_ORIENTATION=+
MARTPIRSALLLAAIVALGLRTAFVSSPAAASQVASSNNGFLSAAGVASGLVAAAPAFAEELPPDEIYNRKVLEAGSYVLIFSAFLVGLVIYQAR